MTQDSDEISKRIALTEAHATTLLSGLRKMLAELRRDLAVLNANTAEQQRRVERLERMARPAQTTMRLQ